MKNYFKLFLIIFLLSIKISASVKDPFYDEVEDYELVEALIRDKKFDLARIELQSDRLKKLDLMKYHLLLGKLYYAQGFWTKSVKEFNLYPNQNTSRVYLGRIFFQIKDYEECIDSYKQVPALFYTNQKQTLIEESDFLKKSQCEFESKLYSQAFKTLVLGFDQFKSYEMKRELITFKLKLGLYHEALVLALDSLALGISNQTLHTKSSKDLASISSRQNFQNKSLVSQYLDIAELFHQKGRVNEAMSILEMGRSLYPIDMDLNLTLSQLYFQKNMLLASEDGFSRAALTDGKYFYHVAELNRQIGHAERASYYNNYVLDDKQKLKHKIATYVDSNKFNMISSLKSVIQRSELNKDDEIKYALAYSLVKMGEVDLPLKYLNSIRKQELLEKTITLKNAVLECQAKNTSCHY